MDIITATALQLAWYKGKDKPDASDKREATNLVAKWNKQRIALGLKPW
ncbi:MULTISPECIES: hypothetical protein [unclassified Pseudoalteromonas]|nr:MULTISPECIES: hypothetical protein [unclassified Pseudoalteromonas]MCF2827112.1 hypothetical protein [Pseudoalteromonas sp. OF5H-5]MCF2834255.1 hypothetical protein [Pseudoalteromonas sp. DL2-H6]MCF2925875.1 hypothetical protein [Pseudoalteromonas sp. DL2-H1]